MTSCSEVATSSRYSGRSFVPQPVTDALNPGGRLVAIVGQPPAMKARMITRAATGPAFATVDLFETVVPPLQGFPQPSGFRF